MKNKRLLWLLCGVLLAAALAAGISARRGRTVVTTVYYELETDLTEPIRIVQLTDLHGRVFGEDNDVLIRMVTDEQPDLILMTGDMVDRYDKNADAACDLIRALAQIAPVYYGYGNHEYGWMNARGESLTPALEAAGATVLDVAYLDLEIKGQPIRLGGYHNYYRQPHMYPLTEEEKRKQLDFCEDFESTDRCKILMSHIPTAWLDWGYIDKFPVDLVLSGHYHGGQIRLPGIGGLYAPYIGLFPEYTAGMFEGEKAACILSTGLGASPGLPRINNLPQIVTVDLIPQQN